MDDPADDCWNWPFWKFGLKRDDLFGSLHDQYNTFASPIQDPAAFHHDVYELSHKASTADELRRLLDARKQQRVRELNETLQSASFEIIANPDLIGTAQWQLAVQLFRTQSLDSLVRYFASYLPADHPWYRSSSSAYSTSASVSDAGSVGSLTDDSQSSFFDEDDEAHHLVDEPYEYPSYTKQQLPASPRSMTMCSDSSAASPSDDDERHEFGYAPTTPARTLSFSESEPDCCDRSSKACLGCTRGVESDDADTTPQSQSRTKHIPLPISDTTTSEITESSTPTPKPEAQSAAFFADAKLSLSTQRYRSRSPSRAHPLSSLEHAPGAHADPRYPQRSRFSTRSQRECSPAVQRRRRSPGEPAARIRKPALAEVRRSRPRGRRLVDS